MDKNEKTARQLLAGSRAEAVTLTPDNTVLTALKVMAEHDIGAVLVMQEDAMAGILSERDCVRKVEHGRMAMWQGGSAGARLFRANFEQLREELLRIGMLTQAELEDDLARLDDPRTLFHSPVMWSVCGRRPHGSL